MGDVIGKGSLPTLVTTATAANLGSQYPQMLVCKPNSKACVMPSRSFCVSASGYSTLPMVASHGSRRPRSISPDWTGSTSCGSLMNSAT